MVGLWTGLACGLDSDDRMLRRYAKYLTDTNTALYRLTASGALGTVALSAEAMEDLSSGGILPLVVLRNGYWANHDGYQYGQMRWNGCDRLPRNVGIRQTLRSEDTCTPLREVKAPTKPTEVMVLY